MMKKRFLIYVFLVFLIGIIEDAEASHISGDLPTHARQVKVKIDKGENELFNFEFIDTTDRNRICYIEVGEEDDWPWGTDWSYYNGVAGRIIRYKSGALVDVVANNCDYPTYDGTCGVLNYPWNDAMSDHCGVCTLAQSSTKYRPKGDILCQEEFWYLCDSNFAGKNITFNGINYYCTPSKEWKTVEICNNDKDDDGDGNADCADPNCFGQNSADILNFHGVGWVNTIQTSTAVYYSNPYCNPTWNKNVCESLSLDYDDEVTQTYKATCEPDTGTTQCGTRSFNADCVCPSDQNKVSAQECAGTGVGRYCYNVYSCSGTTTPIDCTSRKCPNGYTCTIPLPGNGCCGDSSADIGQASESGAVCNKDADGNPKWFAPTTAGQIQYVSDYKIEKVSDGTKWIDCNVNFDEMPESNQKNINIHDYICRGQGQGSIVECCGDDTCNSAEVEGVGERLATGASIQPSAFSSVTTGTCQLSGGYTECSYSTDSSCVCLRGQTKETNQSCSTDPEKEEQCIFERNECGNKCVYDGLNEEACEAKYACSATYESCHDAATTCNDVYICTGTAETECPPDCSTGYQCRGVSPSSSDTNLYYCKQNGIFVTDLDASDEATCEANGNTNGDFVWIGGKCCGDDSGESYNNVGGSEACWKGQLESNGNLIENDKIIVDSGQFYGCNADISSYPSGLVDNIGYCTVKSGYYCDYSSSGVWLQTNGADKGYQKALPNEQPSGCCAQAQCWNGASCVNANAEMEISGNRYRCIAPNNIGQWTAAIQKYTPDGSTPGYCTSNSECFDGTNCVQSGYYNEDDYCENGDWSTRTKLLALELLKIKNSASATDYTLFCDNKSNTLNYFGYSVAVASNPITTYSVANILDSLDVNNFCVLSYGNNVVVATSMNNEPDSNTGFDVFGVDSCSITDDNNYHSCDSSEDKVWYNKGLKSVIFSNNSLSLGGSADFNSIIRNPIDFIVTTIRSLFSSLFSQKPDNLDYLDKINQFDRLYISEKNGKAIRGSLYNKYGGRTAIVEYSGFTRDICTIVNEYRSRLNLGSGVSEISCSISNSNYYVLVQGSTTPLTTINPDNLWPDLTSKLRLR